METVFTSKLKPLFDMVSEDMDLYVPQAQDEHYLYARYNPADREEPTFNDIRVCSPVKEFLFPMREIAAVFPDPGLPEETNPFAVFGLKNCDLRSIEILDRVFKEEDYLDPFYIGRRDKMFIISSDCYGPADGCCCNLFEGKSFPESGFDLNISRIEDGFIIEIGSDRGRRIIEQKDSLFADVPSAALSKRQANREETEEKLSRQNAEYRLDRPIKSLVEDGCDSPVFDVEAKDCVECQGCTRVCPTCHCFYLYDTKQRDSFGKTKIWDSCVRRGFAEVAGGGNPRKVLGDRTRHRLMHKFVHFVDRYGIEMCVGCGRCIDSCAGEIDIRQVLKKLNAELAGKK
ncbi:MAG: 4Fe-4S dicluster domain-containing protein [Planctomycetes bacterium]|nr:4Fe-4S dicluster domain-containing protein [Planctomycetota bacterium]